MPSKEHYCNVVGGGVDDSRVKTFWYRLDVIWEVRYAVEVQYIVSHRSLAKGGWVLFGVESNKKEKLLPLFQLFWNVLPELEFLVVFVIWL